MQKREYSREREELLSVGLGCCVGLSLFPCHEICNFCILQGLCLKDGVKRFLTASNKVIKKEGKTLNHPIGQFGGKSENVNVHFQNVKHIMGDKFEAGLWREESVIWCGLRFA